VRQITWDQEQRINNLIAELRREITAYQIALDNERLRSLSHRYREIGLTDNKACEHLSDCGIVFQVY
jgi:hypothetical protein